MEIRLEYSIGFWIACGHGGDKMSNIRNWTKIWYIERVFYKLWDGVALPRPVTQTFVVWFRIGFFGGIFRIFPFDMEHTITRQIFCPWLFAFSMTRKQFQGRKPYNYLASFLLFQCRLKESFHGQLVKPIVSWNLWTHRYHNGCFR
ncbi:TPA: conjugal transfer protein [Enterococcus faecalis]|nr:conjugal transfer protein [Enterococcus faecalis]HBI3724469.1 conjugal transfer protein [Enterococcus faecalis]HBI3728126.1 conjugal transfer protein [Enterococcus faecalis]HBI3731042.1 conjugal transfer protein [Enterococcus faecalis]HBI3739435.1 conjugal transfer protein [Enterococcus faecalis]